MEDVITVEVQREREAVLAAEAEKDDDKYKKVCCKYYIGLGKWAYTRMTKHSCLTFPGGGGEVVDDSYCKPKPKPDTST